MGVIITVVAVAVIIFILYKKARNKIHTAVDNQKGESPLLDSWAISELRASKGHTTSSQEPASGKMVTKVEETAVSEVSSSRNDEISRKSADRDTRPAFVASASSSLGSRRQKVRERMSVDGSIRLGVGREGIDSASGSSATSETGVTSVTLSQSCSKVVLDKGRKSDERLTLRDARKPISGERRKSLNSDQMPTFALTSSQMDKGKSVNLRRGSAAAVALSQIDTGKSVELRRASASTLSQMNEGESVELRRASASASSQMDKGKSVELRRASASASSIMDKGKSVELRRASASASSQRSTHIMDKSVNMNMRINGGREDAEPASGSMVRGTSQGGIHRGKSVDKDDRLTRHSAVESQRAMYRGKSVDKDDRLTIAGVRRGKSVNKADGLTHNGAQKVISGGGSKSVEGDQRAGYVRKMDESIDNMIRETFVGKATVASQGGMYRGRSLDKDDRLTHNDAHGRISGEGRESVKRYRRPASASSSLSSIHKRSEMERDNEGLTSPATQGVLQRLSVVIHPAKGDSSSVVKTASSDTDTGGNMPDYLAGIHEIRSGSSSYSLSLSSGMEDEVPEAASSIHQMAVVRDRLGSASMLTSSDSAFSSNVTIDDDGNKLKVADKRMRKSDKETKITFTRTKRDNEASVCAVNEKKSMSMNEDLPTNGEKFMKPADSVIRRMFFAGSEDEDPAAWLPPVWEKDNAGMEGTSKAIAGIPTSESASEESSLVSASVIRNMYSGTDVTENLQEQDLSNMAEAKEDDGGRNEQAWDN
jgi:hypothetical protein